MMNSFQQFAQQIPVLTSANLLSMLADESQSTAFDPLAEIRNGGFSSDERGMDERILFLARLRLASMWRRFLAETVDFILIHALK